MERGPKPPEASQIIGRCTWGRGVSKKNEEQGCQIFPHAKRKVRKTGESEKVGKPAKREWSHPRDTEFDRFVGMPAARPHRGPGSCSDSARATSTAAQELAR